MVAEKQQCHICGDLRDPAKLAVEEHKTVLPGTNTKVLERVLYCTDKAECVSTAPTYSFVNSGVSAVAARKRTPMGETISGRPQDESSTEYNSEGKVIGHAESPAR